MLGKGRGPALEGRRGLGSTKLFVSSHRSDKIRQVRGGMALDATMLLKAFALISLVDFLQHVQAKPFDFFAD
ncbi:hypothetical protein H671_2g4804 [Cricetulus griseus]|nr:hypothetical protein H671_2g4804 [Cricetulus griseus]